MLSTANEPLECVNIEAAPSVQETQEVQDNSDDDVIEVVRDEAPIEILSDGEELEIQLQQSQDALKNVVIENVDVVGEHSIINYEDNASDKAVASVDDPLTSKDQNSFGSDLMGALNPAEPQAMEVENCVPSETEFNTKLTLDVQENNLILNDLAKDAADLPKVDETKKTDTTESILPDDGLIGIKARLVEVEGRNVLLVNEFKYTKHYTSRGGRTRWRCSRSYNKCLATAITYNNRIVKLNDRHNHDLITAWNERQTKKDQHTDTHFNPFIPLLQYKVTERSRSKTNTPKQSSLENMSSFIENTPLPTLEIFPLNDNCEESDIKDRIVVKSRHE